MVKSKEQHKSGDVLWNVTQIGVALGFVAMLGVGIEAL